MTLLMDGKSHFKDLSSEVHKPWRDSLTKFHTNLIASPEFLLAVFPGPD